MVTMEPASGSTAPSGPVSFLGMSIRDVKRQENRSKIFAPLATRGVLSCATASFPGPPEASNGSCQASQAIEAAEAPLGGGRFTRGGRGRSAGAGDAGVVLPGGAGEAETAEPVGRAAVVGVIR